MLFTYNILFSHQIHMLGKHIKDFIHPEDLAELRKQFNLKACSDKENCRCTRLVNGKTSSGRTMSMIYSIGELSMYSLSQRENVYR